MTAVPGPAGTTGRRSRLRHEVGPLYLRALRNTVRVPSTLVPPLFIPIFFLVVNTEALGGIVRLPVFRTTDYVAFFLPVSILLSVATVGNGSGLALVQDIASGYFDKLLLAPISRTTLLVSRLMMDGTRAAAQAAIVVLVGLLLGGGVAAGPAGAVLAVALAFLFGLAFAGIGLVIALRTGDPEATQASFVLFFPLVFLAPTFVPLEFLPTWLEAVARVNPITYVMEGLRALFVEGLVWSRLAQAVAATAAIGAVTLGLAFRALAARARR